MSHRTQITLTDAQYARLLEESERTGVGLAELVRRALATVYGDLSPDEALDAFETSFGVWGNHRDNGRAYVEILRPGMRQRLTR
jgi:hypothetical protein